MKILNENILNIDFVIGIVQGLEGAISNFPDDLLLEEYSCSVQMRDSDLIIGSLLFDFFDYYVRLFEQEIIRRGLCRNLIGVSVAFS